MMIDSPRQLVNQILRSSQERLSKSNITLTDQNSRSSVTIKVDKSSSNIEYKIHPRKARDNSPQFSYQPLTNADKSTYPQSTKFVPAKYPEDIIIMTPHDSTPPLQGAHTPVNQHAHFQTQTLHGRDSNYDYDS